MIKLTSHPMKLSLLSSYKYYVISTKNSNTHKILYKTYTKTDLSAADSAHVRHPLATASSTGLPTKEKGEKSEGREN